MEQYLFIEMGVAQETSLNRMTAPPLKREWLLTRD